MASTKSKIKILDKLSINQIAAGEVIEAPHSVVKELVENAIDASSTQILIKVEKGGKETIIVEDNGCGMNKEDLLLAFERHATSKIIHSNDLMQLNTLGFRGEALPSISSVAEVKITTKTNDDLIGWEMSMADGNYIKINEKGCNTGTTVVVNNLFYNTPARKKYLKSTLVEMANITDIISKLALAHPKISFTLISNKRQVFKTPGTGNLLDVISCLWGVDMSNNLIKISDETNHIDGYMGKITYHRPNRKGQMFFVNKRYVKSNVISKGLEEAYHTLLPINRFPFGIIRLTIDPPELDVNIHPTKLEVKFNNPEKIEEHVKQTLYSCIDGYNKNNTVKIIQKETKNNQKPKILSLNHHNDNKTNYTQSKLQFNHNPLPTTAKEKNLLNYFYDNTLDNSGHMPKPIYDSYDQEKEDWTTSLKPIGQFANTYIICEGDDGLYLIDQHAAHERIIYNNMMNNQENCYPSQQLLIPVTLSLTPSEADILIENIIEFRNLGFVLEHFGGSTFIVREVPQDLPLGEEEDCLYELLGLFEDNVKKNRLKYREEMMVLLSCKQAIKAGKTLTHAETSYLLAELQNTTNRSTCPHGRPTIFKFSKEFIANKFIRK